MAESESIAEMKGNQYSADSFDRFGDDLSEVLLTHLPLKDKIRLQCVSKQWRRTLFQRQTILSIDKYGKLDYSIRESIIRRINDITRLKNVLAKCSKVKTILIYS